MVSKVSHSLIVRMLRACRGSGSERSEPRFVVCDLKTGEEQELADWEALRGFLERLWARHLR